MAATTEDRDTKRSDGKLRQMQMSKTLIPRGVLVCINSFGYVVNAIDRESPFAGVSYERMDNSGGAPGDKEIRIVKTGEHQFNYSSGDATQDMVGRVVYIVDNQSVDQPHPDVQFARTPCGTIAEVVSRTQVRVRIDNYTC